MQELIKTKQSMINGVQVNSVSARDLYITLNISKDFSSWIKAQLERGMFEENYDYIRLTQKVVGNNATQIDYILTLDAGKHVCMMSQTKKGKEVRQYFIAVEKQHRQLQQSLPNFNDPIAAARAWIEQAEKAKELSFAVEVQKEEILEAKQVISQQSEVLVGYQDKVDTLDKLIASSQVSTLNDTAKVLDIGRNTLMKLLREKKILMYHNVPFQSYIDRGYFIVKEDVYNDWRTKQTYVSKTTYVTAKGEVWLSKLITSAYTF